MCVQSCGLTKRGKCTHGAGMRCDHSAVFERCDHLVRMCRWMGGQDGGNLQDKVMRQGKGTVIHLRYVPIRHHWTMGSCYRRTSAGWVTVEAGRLYCWHSFMIILKKGQLFFNVYLLVSKYSLLWTGPKMSPFFNSTAFFHQGIHNKNVLFLWDWNGTEGTFKMQLLIKKRKNMFTAYKFSLFGFSVPKLHWIGYMLRLSLYG